MSPLHQAGYFLVKTLFDLYLFTLLLRFIFQVVRADFFNPLSQFVVKVTNPPLIPFRRMIPGYQGIDFACLFLSLLVCTLKLVILFSLQSKFSRFPDPLGILVWSFGDLTVLTINLFLFAIIIQAVMSWVNPYGNHPLQGILIKVTSPVMRPFKRWIPPIGGFDISPIFAIICLQLIKILIADPVFMAGKILTFS